MEEYIVKFKDGYYAKTQPYYAWTFTDDLAQAMKYTSVRNARKRADYPSSYGPGSIDAITIQDKKIMLLSKAQAKKAVINDEKNRLTKRFKESCLADGDDFEEFLENRINKFKSKLK